MPLSQRTYVRNRCSLQIDRDVNASINILKRALNSLSPNFGNAFVKATSEQGEVTLRKMLANTLQQGMQVIPKN